MRENPAGEAKNGALKLQFDRHLRLEFRDAKVTTEAGGAHRAVHRRDHHQATN